MSDTEKPSTTTSHDEISRFKTIPHSATNLSLKSNASKSAAEKKQQTYWEDLEKDYQRKTKTLILTGILLLVAGVVSACYFFKDRNEKIRKGQLEARNELDLTDARTATGPFFI